MNSSYFGIKYEGNWYNFFVTIIIIISKRRDDEGETGAQPLIWQEPEKFAQHIQGFQNSVNMLQQTLCKTTPDQASEALIAVRHQCLACHQFYRVR